MTLHCSNRPRDPGPAADPSPQTQRRDRSQLDLWTFGPLDLWTFGPLDLWTFGPLDLWTFGPLDLWTFGPLDLWTFGPLDLWTFGPLDLWTFGPFTAHRRSTYILPLVWRSSLIGAKS